MQVFSGATRRYLKAAKTSSIVLPLLLSLALTACGGGGSGAAGGFADVSSDKSEGSLQAVTLSPVGSIPSSAPSGTSGTAPTSGINLAPIAGIPATAPSNPGTAPAPGVPLTPISGIPSTDPGVLWGPVLRTFGDAPFKLNGPSSAPVVFYSSNTGVATISGNTVTIVGAGTSQITATVQDPTAPPMAGSNILLTVKKAQPNLSMPTLTLEAHKSTALLQASTKSTGAIKYALSNMVSNSKAAVAFLESDGRTLTPFAAGTAVITATQVPTANYEGGTVSGNLVVTKRKSTISLADLTQPYTNKLVIPVSAETYDEVSDEYRTPTITLSNPEIGTASWDTDNYPSPSIVLDVRKAGATFLTFSLGATANLAPVSKTVSVTFTSVAAAQPGRYLTGVEGYTIYKEDYVFKDNVVTLKLCPSMSEKFDFSFTESVNNYGNAYVTLNGVTLQKIGGRYVANVPGVATGDAPLKLRSFVDAASDGTMILSGSVTEYDVNVELFQDPRVVPKCAPGGNH